MEASAVSDPVIGLFANRIQNDTFTPDVVLMGSVDALILSLKDEHARTSAAKDSSNLVSPPEIVEGI